jgi:hypothetical protein
MLTAAVLLLNHLKAASQEYLNPNQALMASSLEEVVNLSPKDLPKI